MLRAESDGQCMHAAARVRTATQTHHMQEPLEGHAAHHALAAARVHTYSAPAQGSPVLSHPLPVFKGTAGLCSKAQQACFERHGRPALLAAEGILAQASCRGRHHGFDRTMATSRPCTFARVGKCKAWGTQL